MSELMLAGKKALVTGASRGIGRAIALTLADYGADVAVNYSGSAQKAEETAQAVRAMGRSAITIQADVSKQEDCEQMFQTIKAQFGAIDILVNNAGITKDGLAVMMSEEAFDQVVNTNMKGAFFCMKYAGKMMMKQRKGSIINISSISGVRGNVGQINYCGAKAGMIGMTKCLAKELAPRHINVNAVAPGYIETDMTAAMPDQAKDSLLQMIPAGRMGSVQDIAETVAFLASEKAAYITGQTIQVDGGMGI